MDCPQCQESLPQTGLVCPKCGADVAWFVRKPDGAEYGPYDLATVDLCIRESRLGAGDMVRVGAEGRYESAQHLLGERFPKAPLPAAYAVGAGYQVAAPPADPEATKRACGIAALIVFLVVVAAVGVSVPFYQSARRKAVHSSCMANLKQIDLALLMYCQDYDERFPTAGQWEAKLDPYLKNRSLWTCPAKPHEPGYRTNDALAFRAVKSVKWPAQTIAASDAGARVPPMSPVPGATAARHNGGDNFAFADGHVKWFKQGATQALIVTP
jgi:prepilin-type processing-associated H-X9-DG protein